MRAYELDAPSHEIGYAARFLGFANNATEPYLWVQRDEGSAAQIVPRFSYVVGPTGRCLLWAKVHGVHPAIIALAAQWQLLADQVWNEWGQDGPGVHLPVEEFRRRISADLGIASDSGPNATPGTAARTGPGSSQSFERRGGGGAWSIRSLPVSAINWM